MNLNHDAASRGAASRRVVLAAAFLALAATPALAGSASTRGEGVASFYGREHHGGPTASGERFNMNAMTAAHRTAPLGSHLKVTNLKNGKSVVVRVNDRGPFVRGRIIDVSRAAAESLGFTGAGLTRVAIEPAEGGKSGTMKVASLDGDTAERATPRRSDARVVADDRPSMTEADRLMIERTSSNGR